MAAGRSGARGERLAGRQASLSVASKELGSASVTLMAMSTCWGPPTAAYLKRAWAI